ncbi:hypothetical protein DCC26_06310 [Auritidibacter sp. NML120779]|nr:hypothetical protein DCC26_06310 [Auritidibacter sp. NML120779]
MSAVAILGRQVHVLRAPARVSLREPGTRHGLDMLVFIQFYVKHRRVNMLLNQMANLLHVKDFGASEVVGDVAASSVTYRCFHHSNHIVEIEPGSSARPPGCKDGFVIEVS